MLPLSLYIHIPWCIRKCPYCDFNSHKSPDELPEKLYIEALIADLKTDLIQFPGRMIESIFIGGGTPSLLSAQAYDTLLNTIQSLLPFAANIEITLEANPGTVEQQRFRDYRTLGINRLSIGIQSFNPNHLRALGRIHDDNQAHQAIDTARHAGFDNMNIDIMHGLPKQTLTEGLFDLKTALSHQPEHLSWYQLTIEPNTMFYKTRPPLPTEDEAYELETKGFELLKSMQYQRYELSAFGKENKKSRHNLNYWLFGDYYGIGAGAHGKLTTSDGTIYRTQKYRQPKDYLNPDKPFLAVHNQLTHQDLLFEFMLNTTRLEQAIPNALFTQRTGLDFSLLAPKLLEAQQKGLLTLTDTHWQITPFGRRFTNDLQETFLL